MGVNMQIGQNIFRRLPSIASGETIPDYKTKQESVTRLKTFEACAKAIKDANEVIISTRLERKNFDGEVEKFRQQLDERIEHAQIKIKTMQTHIEDIVREAFPSVQIDWDGVTAPDLLADHVFETPPPLTEEQ